METIFVTVKRFACRVWDTNQPASRQTSLRQGSSETLRVHAVTSRRTHAGPEPRGCSRGRLHLLGESCRSVSGPGAFLWASLDLPSSSGCRSPRPVSLTRSPTGLHELLDAGCVSVARRLLSRSRVFAPRIVLGSAR